MRFTFTLLAAAACLQGQSEMGVDPFTNRFKTVKPEALAWKAPHIHFNAKQCKSSPDGVYARSFNTYYACVNGKDVCSEEKGAIPRRLIEAFDARMAAHNERIRDFRSSVEKRLAGSAPRTATIASVSPPAARGAGRAQPPVADDQVSGISTGAAIGEVVALLGQPHSRLTGDFERLNYRLASGGTARLEFESGKLARLQIVPAAK